MYKAGPGDSTKIVKNVSAPVARKGGGHPAKVTGGAKIKGVKINPLMTTGEPSLKIHSRKK